MAMVLGAKMTRGAQRTIVGTVNATVPTVLPDVAIPINTPSVRVALDASVMTDPGTLVRVVIDFSPDGGLTWASTNPGRGMDPFPVVAEFRGGQCVPNRDENGVIALDKTGQPTFTHIPGAPTLWQSGPLAAFSHEARLYPRHMQGGAPVFRASVVTLGNPFSTTAVIDHADVVAALPEESDTHESVAVDARTDLGNTAGSTSLALNHTITGGLTNPALVGTGTTGAATARRISTFQWDATGTPVNLNNLGFQLDGISNCYAEIWGVTGTGGLTSGTKQVKITPAASCEITGGVSSWSNVNQTTMWNAASPQQHSSPGAGGTVSDTLVVTSAVNERVIHCLVENGGSTLTLGGGQTVIHNDNIGAGQHAGVSSDAAGASTVNMTVNGITSGNAFAAIGGSLQFDPGGGGGGASPPTPPTTRGRSTRSRRDTKPSHRKHRKRGLVAKAPAGIVPPASAVPLVRVFFAHRTAGQPRDQAVQPRGRRRKRGLMLKVAGTTPPASIAPRNPIRFAHRRARQHAIVSAQPDRRRMLYITTVLATQSITYTYTGAGGLTIAGAGLIDRILHPNPAGGLTMAGSGSGHLAKVIVGAGGLVIGGHGIASSLLVPRPSGGLVIAGAADAQFRGQYIVVASGGLSIGGAGKTDVVRSVVATGGLSLGGHASALVRFSVSPVGGLRVDGQSVYLVHYVRVGAGGLAIAGTAGQFFVSGAGVAEAFDGLFVILPELDGRALILPS